jgi:solute carrier family 13 (sodium-dependent dicarboxylate transporter), member 2/3/5
MTDRRIKPIGFTLGLAVFAALAFLPTPLQHFGKFGNSPAHAAAAVALMAIWWLTEALPIYWTACVPLVLFPVLRVSPGGFFENLRASAAPYVDPYIFLFAGGMTIAAAMQQWNLHRRLALGVMDRLGADPPRLLAGFLAATAFISLWISNTATAAMMLPIGLALMAQLETQVGRRLPHYGMAIMLAIAYGSNIGGIGTKIGTAPNAQFAGFLERLGTSISFFQFMIVGLPFVVFFLPVAWWVLWRIARREELSGDLGGKALHREIAKLGQVKRGEAIVLAVFLAAAALWIGAKPLTEVLRGRFGKAIGSSHVEGGIAVLAALVLLALSTGGRRVLAPRSLRTVPWETLLLLGGGFSMAAAVQGSGLSQWAAGQLKVVRGMPAFEQVLLASVVTVAVSAVASNTSTIAIMLVVLKDAAAPEALHTVLFAATIASSCDFALPAGTPPNAIVFGSGYVTIPRMARTGILLDLAAALLAAAWCWLIVPRVL